MAIRDLGKGVERAGFKNVVEGVRLRYGGKEGGSAAGRGGRVQNLQALWGLNDGELAGVWVYFISNCWALTTSSGEEGMRGGERAKFMEVWEAGVCKRTMEFSENIQGLNIWGLRWRRMTSGAVGF